MVSESLRGFLVPDEGHDFISCDFSAIEARKTAWLAGEEKVLDIFRTHGKIYEAAASDIYRVPIEEVTKEQRQIGKVAVLALGFGGGKGAFAMMAKGYGVEVTEAQADAIKEKWRDANPKIVTFWRALEDAAMWAVRHPNKIAILKRPYAQISFKKSGSFLWCQLPSKGVICYPYPKIEAKETPWGQMKDVVTYMTENSLSRKWERTHTYGGSLCENVVQASSRDILAYAMLRLEERGYPIIMHVHDEIVCQVKEGRGSVSEMAQIMSEVPEWARGMPISAEGWRGKRYRK